MNAITLYRLARTCHEHRIPILPKLIKGLIFVLFNSVVPYTAKIGKDSKLAYGGMGVVIHSRSVIGDRVIIGQGVTIGRKLEPEGVPIIGNDVYLSAGARILGGIRIGDNVIVGANAVVTKDIPSNSIAGGIPAKVIRQIDKNIYDILENIY